MPTEILICGLFAMSFMSFSFVAAAAIAVVAAAFLVTLFFPRRHRSNRSNSSI